MRESGQGSAPPPLRPPANQIGAARSRGVHGPERLLASDVTVGRLVLCIVRSEGREKWPAPAHTTHTHASRTATIAAACTGRAASVTKKPQSGLSRSLFLSTFTFFPRRFSVSGPGVLTPASPALGGGAAWRAGRVRMRAQALLVARQVQHPPT